MDNNNQTPNAGLSKAKTLQTLQVGRGLAALAVLLSHAEGTLELPKYLGNEIWPFFRGGVFGVAFFFVLSGFVIFQAHRADLGFPKRVGNFLWKRFVRLFPILWITLVIVVVALLVVFHTSTPLKDFVWAVLALPAQSEPLLPVEWTLRREVLFYLMFALTIVWPRIGFAALGAWFASSAIVPLLPGTDGWKPVFDTYHLLFGMGMLTCLFVDRFPSSSPVLLMLAGAVVFFSCWVLQANEIADHGPALDFCSGLGATAIIWGAVANERRGGFEAPRFLLLLGDASYAIYLIHFMVVSALCKVLAPLGGSIPDQLVFLAVSAGALIAGIAFHLLVEKPVLTVLRRLGPQQRPSSSSSAN